MEPLNGIKRIGHRVQEGGFVKNAKFPLGTYDGICERNEHAKHK